MAELTRLKSQEVQEYYRDFEMQYHQATVACSRRVLTEAASVL